jgi:hypothetical protein
VTATPDITLGELCETLNEQLGVDVSESTMCRVMKQLNLTSKKKAPHPSERLQGLRGEYCNEVREVRVEDLVFMDESGVNLGLIRLFAWAIRDQRACGAQPKRVKNVSIVG